MFNKIKENVLLTVATCFLCLTFAFSFTANAQTSGGCESCGGTYGDNACYSVDAGAMNCWDMGNTCNNSGGCANGEPTKTLQKA